MKTLNVELGERSYPIYIDANSLSNASLVQDHIHGKTVTVISNETVAPLYIETLKKILTTYKVTTVILPDGESHKHLETVNQIYTEMLEARCDRKSTIIALGGGVVGDISGFAASSYQRGINFIQVPTTLLSMVDSSVGGKTGVNHKLGKNMIGAFYQPQSVVIDINTLDTLDDRELSAGLAEVIKYGLIRDVEFLHWLDENVDALLSRNPEALSYAIYRSCQHKAEIVAADEKEAGQRALLNLGHTFGHAIETGMGYGELLHGEAVAIGMVMAAKMSKELGWIEQADVEFTQKILQRAQLPINPPEAMTSKIFNDLMLIDKKVQDGVLYLILLRALGDAVYTSDYSVEALQKTIM